MSIIDRKFLLAQLFATIIKHIFQSIRIQDIEIVYLSSLEYITLKLSMSNILKSTSICEKI